MQSKWASVRAFEQRKAGCQGYAYLFYDMCAACDIHTEYISGYSKQHNNDMADAVVHSNVPEDSSHAWNLVSTDDGDFFVDVTWAAGKYSPGKFTKQFDDSWFDVDPCYMITSHFPFNRKKQMLDPPFSKEQFITLPRLDPSLEKLGFDGRELLEFVSTHLDAWAPAFSSEALKLTEEGTSINFYKVPIAKKLQKNMRYEFAAVCDGVYADSLMSYSSEARIEFQKAGKTICAGRYEFETETPKPYRADFTAWASAGNSGLKSSTDTSDSSFVAEDSIKLKPSARGSIGKDGKITINGYVVPNTEEVVVVPKGKVATIEGTEPLADPPHIEPGAVMYTHCENDSAFPVGRKVKLSSFAMSKYPVSNELYVRVMENVEGLYGSNTRKVTLKNGESVFAYYRYEPDFSDERPYYPGYFGAIFFCNALTKLVMGEEHCVYCIKEEEVKAVSSDMTGQLSDEDIDKICKDLNISRENILYIGKGAGGHKITYATSDFTKKGYRLPTDAEWEFAARGGNPTADSWYEDLKSPNPLGICNWGREHVEDWLVTNREYDAKDSRDASGYVLDPCKKSSACRSARLGVDRRVMLNPSGDGGNIRLVRNLD